jgi:hypothetical protein
MSEVSVSYSKKQLLQKLGAGLCKLGYSETPLNTGMFEGLYYKQVEELILTLAIELSRIYTDRFTASFYLAPSFELPYYRYGPVLEIAYQRIGRFLRPDERLLLLEPEFCAPGVIDAWWIGFAPQSVACFLKAIELCEPRFLAQESLFEKVRTSEDAHEWISTLEKVKQLASTLESAPCTLSRQPKKYSKDVSPAYYWAAELVLIQKFGAKTVSHDGVRRVAIDAWRMTQIFQLTCTK